MAVEWTPERVRRTLLMRRYAWGKSSTQIADETGLPGKIIADVLVGRSFSSATAARLISYFTTPAGPAALRQNYNKAHRHSRRRWALLRKVKMLGAIGRQFGYGPAAGSAATRNDGELMCYCWTIEDRIKRIILARHPKAKKFFRMQDSQPVWLWLEILDRYKIPRVDPPPRNPFRGRPQGLSPHHVPSSLRRAGFSPPEGRRV